MMVSVITESSPAGASAAYTILMFSPSWQLTSA